MNFNQKGADFEREQTRKISLWLSDGKDQDLLWRSSQSGGRVTAGKVKGAQYGDLWYQKYTKESERFLTTFCTELKFYKGIDILKAWLNDKDDFNQWWLKCVKESRLNNVHPLLIVKTNRQPVIMCFESYLVHNILKDFKRIRVMRCDYDITLIKQDDLFTNHTWENFLKQLE